MPALNDAQRDFVDLLTARSALTFGTYTLKSGRSSPFFINAGRFDQGGDLPRLGRAYASTIRSRFGDRIEIIFGPAYKGIPLALATATAYEELVGHPVGWCFDRKEAKSHGDGGSFVGAQPTTGRRVVIVDDVITAGTALRETAARLAPTGALIAGAVVAVDRQERGLGDTAAVQETAEACGFPVIAIISITEAVEHLVGCQGPGRLSEADRQRVLEHVRQAGVRSA